jgi:uncharacterized protein
MGQRAQNSRSAERRETRARTATDVTTEELSFASGDERCAAALYRPPDPDGATPCVVMAQGFSLTRNDGVPRYAEGFAQAGLAALTFDYRYLGDSTGEPRQSVDHVRQRQDLTAAIDVARSLDGIDPERIVVWGYSFGGGHALFHAAQDARLAAAILHFPLVDGRAATRSANPVTVLRVTGAQLRALARRRLMHLPVTGPPGSLAMLTTEEAEPGFDAIRASGSLWRNEFRARPTQPLFTYRPVKVAARVRCPLLACVGERDTIVPGPPIVRTAQRAPRGTLRRYDLAHFGSFFDGFEEVFADQVAFLDHHVGAVAEP